MWARSLILSCIGLAVFAEVSLAAAHKDPRASDGNCPSMFAVVDLGRWVVDPQGNPVLDYGGLLYRVAPDGSETQPPAEDYYLCIRPEDLEGRQQLLDGLPVPLVDGLIDADLGGDRGGYYSARARKSVSAWVDLFSSAEQAFEAVELRNKAEFQRWQGTSSPSRQALVQGENYSCFHDPANPTLEGHGSYTCLMTIEGMPRPDTFVSCGQWVGGCSASFSLRSGVWIHIQGDFLPHWDEASRARSIPEAVDFWSDLVRATARNFETALVSRRNDITLEVK